MTYTDFLPPMFASRYGSWGALISADTAPVFTAALEYAAANSVKCEFHYGQRLVTGEIANADSIARKINVSYLASTLLPNLGLRTGHELKHIGQFDSRPKDPEISGWDRLNRDIKRSNELGQNCLAEEYHLLRPADSAFFRIGLEFDANPFGKIVCGELTSAFNASPRPTMRDLIGHCDAMSEEFLTFRIELDYEFGGQYSILHSLKKLSQKYDVRPSVDWVTLPMGTLQHVSAPFWENGNLMPPAYLTRYNKELKDWYEMSGCHPHADQVIKEAKTVLNFRPGSSPTRSPTEAYSFI